MSDNPRQNDGGQNLTRTAEYRLTMLQRAGGAFTAAQVKSMLGCTSAENVREAVAAHRLLAVDVTGVMLFPAFQFDENRVVPGMAAVLSAAPKTNPWAVLQFFVAGDEGLGDDLPMDLVKGGRDDIARASRFARTLEC